MQRMSLTKKLSNQKVKYENKLKEMEELIRSK